MKLTRTLLSGLAMVSLATAPAIAQAQRATAPVEETDDLGGEPGSGWIAILGVIAVVTLAVIAATNDDDEAVSP